MTSPVLAQKARTEKSQTSSPVQSREREREREGVPLCSVVGARPSALRTHARLPPAPLPAVPSQPGVPGTGVPPWALGVWPYTASPQRSRRERALPPSRLRRNKSLCGRRQHLLLLPLACSGSTMPSRRQSGYRGRPCPRCGRAARRLRADHRRRLHAGGVECRAARHRRREGGGVVVVVGGGN
jgi:hypothetical protein